MLFHRSINRLARAAGLAIMVLALSAATAAAHTQTVTPNGNGEGFTQPISNPWARLIATPPLRPSLLIARTGSFSSCRAPPFRARLCPTPAVRSTATDRPQFRTTLRSY